MATSTQTEPTKENSSGKKAFINHEKHHTGFADTGSLYFNYYAFSKGTPRTEFLGLVHYRAASASHNPSANYTQYTFIPAYCFLHISVLVWTPNRFWNILNLKYYFIFICHFSFVLFCGKEIRMRAELNKGKNWLTALNQRQLKQDPDEPDIDTFLTIRCQIGHIHRKDGDFLKKVLFHSQRR